MNDNLTMSSLKSFDKSNDKLYSDDLCFISLGMNCIPRMLLGTVFDIRKMNSCNHRLPFDGSFHHHDHLVDIFQTDFSHFSSKDHLEFDKTDKRTNPKARRFVNTFYGSVYPHENSKITVEKYSETQKKRLDAFKRIMNSGKKIVFLIYYYSLEEQKNSHKLYEINRSIKKLFPLTDFYTIGIIPGSTESVEYNRNICAIEIAFRRDKFQTQTGDFDNTEWGIEAIGFLFSTIFK